MPRAVSSIVSDATITVGDESANARAITIQLKNGWGRNINFSAEVELAVLLDADGADYAATGGSTGIAIGASGKLQQIIAKKRFKARSDDSGVIALTWTDTGTEAAYLGVILPNGKQVISDALTNA